ncbi:hypothetical protein IF2G_09702 [Cordyceps javanica]|nr:hypothetical protein IF2G_09702 [Cordyceps javanica]
MEVHTSHLVHGTQTQTQCQESLCPEATGTRAKQTEEEDRGVKRGQGLLKPTLLYISVTRCIDSMGGRGRKGDGPWSDG